MYLRERWQGIQLIIHEHPVVFGSFVVAFVSGMIGSAVLPDSFRQELLQGFIDKITDMRPEGFGLMVDIFFNNIQVTFLLLLLGWTFLFVYAVMMFNGIMIGLVLQVLGEMFVRNAWFWVFVAASLFPHAIFELPAFFLAGLVGFMIGVKMFFPHRIARDMTRKAYLKHLGRTLFPVIIGLIAMAAVVEAFVTPWFSARLENRLEIQNTETGVAVQN